MQNLINKIHLGDCLEFMKPLPDKCIDLVLTDPPYGKGNAEYDTSLRYGGWWDKYKNGKALSQVFVEIFRVSKHQIIWGGNYFNLPPTRCFNVWRKLIHTANTALLWSAGTGAGLSMKKLCVLLSFLGGIGK